MAGAPIDVSYENNTQITGIHIRYFPKDVAIWSNERVSIVDIEEILLLNVTGLMLCTGSEGGCYEHMPLDKSGEDNQII